MCSVVLSGLALRTGSQLAAARIMVGIDQAELARRAGIQAQSISRWEKYGHDRIKAQTDKLDAVQRVLEAAGIEFLNDDAPGVRFRPKSKAKPKP